MMNKKLLGRWGEDTAAEYLQQHRYKIIGRNYTVRMGEIDLIAQKSDFVVFVEVKLRKNNDFADAKEFVTTAKQERVRTAAQIWLSANPTALQPRFDVVEVYAPDGVQTHRPVINHIENAF